MYHSHDYNLKEEFQRYYQIGIMHKQNPWLYKYFGKPAGEGFKYMYSQIKFILKSNPLLLLSVIAKNVNKFLAFNLGLKLKRSSNVL